VLKKKYIQRKSAIEITLTDGRSLFFSFPNINDMDEVSGNLVRLRKIGLSPQLNYYKTMDPRKIVEKSGMMKNWQTSQISNFSYLMQLNHLASRSYNDLTQYPVFPWVLQETNQSSPSL
jgi:hypothetical protein